MSNGIHEELQEIIDKDEVPQRVTNGLLLGLMLEMYKMLVAAQQETVAYRDEAASDRKSIKQRVDDLERYRDNYPSFLYIWKYERARAVQLLLIWGLVIVVAFSPFIVFEWRADILNMLRSIIF